MKSAMAFALVFSAVVPAWAFEGMTPELAAHLEVLGPGELARVNVIMARRYDPLAMAALTEGLPRAGRRAVVVNELKRFADGTQRDVLALLEEAEGAGRARDVRVMWLVNGVNAWVDADTAYRLAARGDVASVDWDEEIPLEQVLEGEAVAAATRDEIAWGVAKVRAPDVWAAGYRGEGVTVCVFDTGCNYNHLDLKDHMWDGGSQYPKHGWNFAQNNEETMDYNGHGTHVCGTVASDGTAGTEAGVAPKATIMICKISGVESTVWQAWQFALEQGADLGTCSFGWRRSANPDYAGWRRGSEMQLAAGFIQFKSAGNYRQYLNSTDPLPWNVSAPGNCPPPWLHPDQTLKGGLASMMAVGATTQDDVYVYFSSVGPSSWETIDPWKDYPYEGGNKMGLLKPDVAAPGYQIKSCRHNDNSGYVNMSGTSMAAPHAAGCAALLLDIDDELTPEELSEIMQLTALDLGPKGKDNDYGAGRLDAYEAARTLFTPVELQYFRAQGRPAAVLLSWDYREGAASGVFNVYRERRDGEREKSNPAPISGRPPLRYLDRAAEEGVTYRYWLEYVPRAGASRTFGPAEGRAGAKAASFAFAAPRPNPARDLVTFEFTVPYDDSGAELAVFDLAGRRVATVVRGARAGRNAAAWPLLDGRGGPIAPGVYICRLTSAAGSAVRRLAVAR